MPSVWEALAQIWDSCKSSSLQFWIHTYWPIASILYISILFPECLQSSATCYLHVAKVSVHESFGTRKFRYTLSTKSEVCQCFSEMPSPQFSPRGPHRKGDKTPSFPHLCTECKHRCMLHPRRARTSPVLQIAEWPKLALPERCQWHQAPTRLTADSESKQVASQASFTSAATQSSKPGPTVRPTR